jgi:hypothetical protein
VSDGELEPPALRARAAAHGVGRLAITDHDSLGAYRWGDGVVFEEARRLGLELFDEEDGRLLRDSLRHAGEALELRFTRGSDAHFPADFERVYGPIPSQGGEP